MIMNHLHCKYTTVMDYFDIEIVTAETCFFFVHTFISLYYFCGKILIATPASRVVVKKTLRSGRTFIVHCCIVHCQVFFVFNILQPFLVSNYNLMTVVKYKYCIINKMSNANTTMTTSNKGVSYDKP